MRAARNRVVLVFGKKGTGKSYSIKRELDRMPRHAPLYVWDHNREYAGPSARDAIKHAVVFTTWRDFVRAASSQQGHVGRVVLQCDRRDFARFLRFVYRCGGCTVVLDELHCYVDEKANREALRDLLYTSRHLRVNVIAASWRPTDLPTWVRHCYDELRAFSTSERNDLRWYADSGLPAWETALPALRAHRYLTHRAA